MIEAYEIGAKIVLDDRVMGSVGKLADQFKVVQDAVDRTNAMLRDTVGLVSSVASAARGMASAWQSAASAAERMAHAAGGMAGGSGGGGGPFIGGGGGRDGGGAVTLPGQYGGPNFTMVGDEPLRLPAPAMSIFGPGGGGGGGSGGGADRAASGGLDPVHLLSAWYLGSQAAHGVGEAASAFFVPGMTVETQLNQIGNMTPAGQNVSAIKAQAYAAAKQIVRSNPGMSITDALAMEANFYSVDRDMGETATLSQRYARDNYAIGNVKKPGFQDELYSALRGGEEAGYFNGKNGKIDATKEMSFLEMATRLDISSNGNITPEGVLTTIGNIGPGATQMSDTAMQRALIASSVLGPSKEGTGLNAMYQEFLGGKMSQGTARALHENGVLPDYMFGKDGKILNEYKYGIGMVQLQGAVLADSGLALTDPIDWAKKHLFSKFFDANGILKPGEANAEAFMQATQQDFSRLPGGKVAANAVMNALIQDRMADNANNIPSMNQIANNDINTTNVQMKNFGASFKDLMISSDRPFLPLAATVGKYGASALNYTSDAIDAHQIGAAAVEATGMAAMIAAAAAIAEKVVGGWLGVKMTLGDTVGGKILTTGAGLAVGDAAGASSQLGTIAAIASAVAAYFDTAPMRAQTAARLASVSSYDAAGDLGSSAQKPFYVYTVNGAQLVSPSPTMATGPTAPNSATTSRRPGAVNRLSGHQ